MTEWKDISSFSRGETDRTPTVWELRPTPSVRLTVHRHISNPGAWHLSCEPWYSTFKISAQGADEAKQQAIAMIRSRARELLAELREPD